jgi:uncharacterized protein (TIGR02147 family)
MDEIMDAATILGESSRLADGLRNLIYLRENNLEPNFAKIGREIGIHSRGYLADVLSGRRRLASRYDEKLVAYLQLRPLEAEVLRTLLKVERAKDYQEKKRLRATCSRLRKVLLAERMNAPVFDAPSLYCCVVLTAIQVLGGSASENQLIDYLGQEQKERIIAGIEELRDRRLLEPNSQKLVVLKNIVLFKDNDQGQTHRQFLRNAINEAAQNVECWAESPDKSCFQSFVISTTAADYLEAVKRIKFYMYEQMVALEKSTGDAIIQVNTQIFPHRLV